MTGLRCSTMFVDKGGIRLILCGADAVEIVNGNSLCFECSAKLTVRHDELNRPRVVKRRSDIGLVYFCGKCNKSHPVGRKIWTTHVKYEAPDPAHNRYTEPITWITYAQLTNRTSVENETPVESRKGDGE